MSCTKRLNIKVHGRCIMDRQLLIKVLFDFGSVSTRDCSSFTDCKLGFRRIVYIACRVIKTISLPEYSWQLNGCKVAEFCIVASIFRRYDQSESLLQRDVMSVTTSTIWWAIHKECISISLFRHCRRQCATILFPK
jgi:hypothetical protein